MKDPIAESLGAETPLVPIARPEVDVGQQEDFDVARINLKEMVEQAMGALPDMFNVLSQTQDSKMYIAASAFLKTVQDLNSEMVKIHKEKKVNKVEEVAPANNVTTNNVFIGTTEEYLRLRRERKELEQQNKQSEQVIDVEVIEAVEKSQEASLLDDQ